MSQCPALFLLKKECQDCPATIDNISQMSKDIQYQLTRLGICKGCPISISQNTIFSDPIIFNINNSQIALRKKDAENIMINLNRQGEKS